MIGRLNSAMRGSVSEGGSARRQQLYMLLTMAVRMGGGLLTFFVQARYLGPHNFGVIGAAISIAGIGSLVSDFGLHAYVMRRAGVRSSDVRRLVAAATAAKIMLSIPVTIGCFLWVWFAGFSGVETWAVMLTVIGLQLHACADILFLQVRIQRRVVMELRTTLWTYGVMVASVAAAAILTNDLFYTALAFLLSRIVYGTGAWHATIGFAAMGMVQRFAMRLRRLRALLRAARFYALDAVLTNVITNIDVVVMAYFIDARAIGIYVAGSRLVQNGLPLFVMHANLYLPSLSAQVHSKDPGIARTLRRFNLEFFLLALLTFAGVMIGGPIANTYIYGSAYAELNMLWVAFAAYVMGRVLICAYGVQLIAYDAIAARIAILGSTLFLTMIALVVALPQGGIHAAAWVMAASAFATACLMIAGIARYSLRPFAMVAQTIACIALACIVAAVFRH